MSERSTQVAQLKSVLDNKKVKSRFFDVMNRQEAMQYMATIINEYSNNESLLKCTPMSVIGASLISASLDLPINSNLGFAYLVPYGKKAQFQLGYKGFIQLALRTGKYKKINVVEVYKEQFKSFDRLSENLDADFTQAGKGDVIGYASYMELNTGFKKTTYWTIEEVKDHAMKYSQAYKKGFNSPWKTNFDAMAKKTVLKMMISKWGIMTPKMKQAQENDQKVFKDIDDGEYSDNPENAPREKTNTEKEFERKQKLDEESEDADYEEIDDENEDDLKDTPLGKGGK